MMVQLAAVGAYALPNPTVDGKEASGLPNPADAFCAAQGGQVEFFTEAAGTASYCRIGTGLIDVWTLFRAQTTQEQAVDVFMNHPIPQIDIGPGGANPADVYCGIVQGTTIIVKDQTGNEYGMCQFADNSIIDSWTLFGGAANAQPLAQVLTAIRSN